MEIQLRSNENNRSTRSVEVYAFTYDPNERKFGMPYCSGDNWGCLLECPLTAVPVEMRFQGTAFIRFEKAADVEALAEWLIEAEKTAREGYRTMRD